MSYLEQAAQEGAIIQEMLSGLDNPLDKHLPRSEKEMESMTVGMKILSAATTASGCDAAGYYVLDSTGKYTLLDTLDLYDLDHTNPTKFPERTALMPDTFATEEAARATSEKGGYYHIPVRDADGKVRAIVALHPPQDGYIRIQSAAEALQDQQWQALPPEQKMTTSMPDMHEPAAVRTAKLQMASTIVGSFQNTLMKDWDRILPAGEDIGTVKERDTFLLKLAKDMFRTFPKKEQIPEAEYAAVMNAHNGEELRTAMRPLLKYDEAMQGPHVVGTAEIMKYSVDALNEGTHKRRPVMTQDESETVQLLAMLHDVGKSQFSYAFFRDWTMKGKTPEEQAEQKKRSVELVTKNANHAYLDNAVLSLFPASAKVVADHHHGHDRYESHELTRDLGDKVDEYVIANQPVPPEKVHMLSRMLRVADVTEAITARTSGTLADALRSLAEKSADFGKGADGKDKRFAEVMKEIADGKTPAYTVRPFTANTIDMDALCFMIEHDVFQKFGAQRDRDERRAGGQGWMGDKTPKYNADEVCQVGEAILKAFHWQERKQELTMGQDGTERTRDQNIREDVHDATLLNPPHVPRSRDHKALMR